MACLALRKLQPGPWAWLIRRWTRSQWDHCELVVGKSWYSSQLLHGGVRRLDGQPPGDWDFISLPWADDGEIESYFATTDAQGYDWLAVVGSQVLNARWHLNGSQMCSEWCASALGLPNGEIYNPGTLARLCRRINEIWGDKT